MIFPDDDVDPEIRDWLSRMFAASRALGAGPDTPPARLREICETQREPWRSGGPQMWRSIDLSIGEDGMRARLHRPTDAAVLPVLVYLHGGGWTLFSIDTHDRVMREYAVRAGVAVLGIDYRLAPEHRFPAALDDVDEALAWVAREGEAHGLDPARLALGGDSAGANLALATALRRRDREGRVPDALLLNYGAFDKAHRPSHTRYGDGDRYMLTPSEMDAFWESYLGPEPDRAPYACLLDAPLDAMPPAWMCVAQCDVLLDENLAMAQRLSAAGTEVELRVYDGATHSFLEAVAMSSIAERAFVEASAWLRDVLAG